MFKVILTLTALLCAVPRLAYSAEPVKGSVYAHDIRVEGGTLRTDIAARLVTADSIKFDIKELTFQKSVAFTSDSLPIRLWLLVDASQLCQTYALDSYLARLTGELRRTVADGSRVSVVSFANGSLVTVSEEKGVSDLESLKIHCSPKQNSTSYEAALNQMLETLPNDGLKNVAWVFTSGNIQVSAATQAKLVKNQFSVNLILYNAIMEKEIERVVDRQNVSAGAKVFSLSVLNREEKIIPERWYRLAIAVPGYLTKDVMNVSISAEQKGAALAADTISAKVNLKARSFWEKYGNTIFLVLLVLGLAALVVGLTRYYRAERCAKCSRYLRHGDTECLFCSEELACLVGQFNAFDRHKKDRQDVVFLRKTKTHVGFRRGHEIRLSGKVSGKGLLASIVSENGEGGRKAFLLVPEMKGLIFINGNLTDNPRYLGHGDEITVSGNRLTFVHGGIQNEVRK